MTSIQEGEQTPHNSMNQLGLTTVVSKHNTAKSCWVILYGKVYDVSIPQLVC